MPQPIRMADDPSGLEPSAIFQIVPAERWTMKKDVHVGGLVNYTVKRAGIDIGCIYEQWSGGRDKTWFWSLYRIHQLGNYQGRGDSLDDCKKVLKATWDMLVLERGIKAVEAALLPIHCRPVTYPLRVKPPKLRPWPAKP